jgi:hypothetical protein
VKRAKPVEVRSMEGSGIADRSFEQLANSQDV